MYYDDDDAPEFWSDEPTRPLDRIRTRLSPAGNPPMPPSRPHSPPVSGRSHTGEIPLVPARRRGTSRPGSAGRTAAASTSWTDLTTRVRDTAQQLKPRPRSHGPYDFQADEYEPGDAGARTPGRSHGSARGLTTGPDRSLAAIDPLMRRLGSLVLIIALATPVALMMRTGDAESQGLRPDESTLVTTPLTDPTLSSVSTIAVTDPLATVAAVTAAATVTAAPATPAPTVTTAAPATTAARVAPTTAAPKVCNTGYKVVRGDSWSRIAQKVGVATGDMLDANNATAKTLLLPGKIVCMPNGATNTTVAPPTTKPKPTPTTTKPTPTTVKPPAVRPTYTREEVIQMIRDIWPDHLEARAIEIANRESHYNPYAVNSCCYGVFQINYNAHKKWMPTIGVTNAAQLFDPRLNITAAYVVYQRSNSFAPWGG